MFEYLKNLFAELSYFRLRRDTMRDISINPLLQWWREHECEPHLLEKTQYLLASNISTIKPEEIIIANEISTLVHRGWYDRKAFLDGKLRWPRFRFGCLILSVLLLVGIFFIYGAQSVGPWALIFDAGIPQGSFIVFAVVCFLILLSPLGWLVTVFERFNYAGITRNIIFVLMALLSIIVGGVLLALVQIQYDLLATWVQIAGLILMMILSSVLLSRILFCFAIRYMKHVVNSLRQQT